jgi:hypothetical protein
MACSPPGDVLIVLGSCGVLGFDGMCGFVERFHLLKAYVLIGANESILRLRHDGLILKE